jgi:hypothetical protein
MLGLPRASVSRKICMYVSVDTGLRFGDLRKICTDQRNAEVIRGLHPLKGGGPAAFAVPDPLAPAGYYHMLIDGAHSKQPWGSSNWENWEVNQKFSNTRKWVIPAGKTHATTKRMYRGAIYKGRIKITMKHDMPGGMADAMMEAFVRAGFGKP